MKSKITVKMKMIWFLIIFGLCAMEFPGIIFVGKIADPFILGVPFLYAYIIFWWLYLCIVIFYAYKNNWGRNH